jgi:AraC family transcriptional regulator
MTRVSTRVESTLQWPGMRSEYAWLPPHEGFSVTGANQIGASFTHHRGLVYSQAGRESVRNVAAGAVFVTGTEGIAWSRVRERTEALEIYPDLTLLQQTSVRRAGRLVTVEPASFVRDPVVYSIAALLKRVHVTGAYLSDIAASTLAQRLVEQLIDVYSGSSPRSRSMRSGRLNMRTLDSLNDYIETHLASTITLQQLAEVARLSPFHFARGFKRSTGMTPHQFVTFRRIERAKCELLAGKRTIAQIANSVQFSNLSHFRRVFRFYYGVSPAAFRG